MRIRIREYPLNIPSSFRSVASILTIALAVFVLIDQKIDFNESNRKLEIERSARLEAEKKNDQLNKYIDSNPVIPTPGSLQRSGISSELATRHYLIYVQLDIITGIAGTPEDKQRWLRDRMREGALHHLLEGYTLFGMDGTYDPSKIAIQMDIIIDWEQSKLFSELKNGSGINHNELYDKTIIKLANAFSEIVKREKLDVVVAVTPVTKVNQKAFDAISDLGVLKNEKIGTVGNEEFGEIVRDTLKIKGVLANEWREGDEELYSIQSEVTPELTVKFKYVGDKKYRIE